MAQEKEIKNFVFNYTDGTSETVEKGFFCKVKRRTKRRSDIKFRNGRRIWKRPDTNCPGLRRVGRTRECSTKMKVRK